MNKISWKEKVLTLLLIFLVISATLAGIAGIGILVASKHYIFAGLLFSAMLTAVAAPRILLD